MTPLESLLFYAGIIADESVIRILLENAPAFVLVEAKPCPSNSISLAEEMPVTGLVVYEPYIEPVPADRSALLLGQSWCSSRPYDNVIWAFQVPDLLDVRVGSNSEFRAVNRVGRSLLLSNKFSCFEIWRVLEEQQLRNTKCPRKYHKYYDTCVRTTNKFEHVVGNPR